MKLKFSVTRQVEIHPDLVEEKINNYLKTNFYRVTDRGPGYVIFKNDEFSDRRRSQSDTYIRIGEGKLEFHSFAEQQTTVKLIHLTSVTYRVFIIMIISAFAIYTHSTYVMPIIMSFVITIPLIFRYFYFKGNGFYEILDS